MQHTLHTLTKYTLGLAYKLVLVGAGGAMAPPDFGRSVNPISTRGQFMPTTLLTPQIFRPSYGPAQDHHDDSGNV